MENLILNKFIQEYMCSFEPTKHEELTINEAEQRYGIDIDRSSIGYDRGIFFNKLGLRVDHNGKIRISTYLPENSSTNKKIDFYIILKIRK